jgi:LSD1 subclass zinc finger protein
MNALITGLMCPSCRKWLNYYEATSTIVCQNPGCPEYGIHYKPPVVELEKEEK